MTPILDQEYCPFVKKWLEAGIDLKAYINRNRSAIIEVKTFKLQTDIVLYDYIIFVDGSMMLWDWDYERRISVKNWIFTNISSDEAEERIRNPIPDDV